MKKYLIFCILLGLVLIAGSAMAAGQTTTLLVYMCGTDLQEDACVDLAEMAEVEAGDAINMVVLAGGAETWDLEDLKGNSRTLAVIRDGYFESLEDVGHKSMGARESLQEFLEYGLTNYPADRTIVILWDHGAGSEGGICFDQTADEDGLTLVEINEVLENLKQSVPGYHINIFGCDACMMATYEMAALLSHHNIDYFVASEELEPGTGWNYTGWLQPLKEDPGISDEDLSRYIIESYMEAGLQNDPDDYLTLSAVKLSEVAALEKSMESFASVMSGQIQGGNLTTVRRGRSRLYTFGSFADGSWDMVDLGAALDAYAQFDQEKASAVRSSLSKAVILSSQTDNLPVCSGLSVLIPQDMASSYDEYQEGLNITEVIPNWISFVNSYVSQLQGGSFHITASDACQVSAGYEADGSFSSCQYFDGIMDWDDEEECYYPEESQEQEIVVSDSEMGFTAKLSQEELANLDYVEGMLMMDLSDKDGEGYVDFGTMQNNLIDWNTGTVVSLYDGTWPVFGGQMVALYDQTVNASSRRSLIKVKLNGVYTYLVVIFPAGSKEGRVIGANAGYDDSGLPIRNVTRLQPGDKIIPVYTLYLEEEGKEDLQESEYLGEAITWQEGMTVTYEDLSNEDDPTPMVFCFAFNDIFGESTLSELIEFEL